MFKRLTGYEAAVNRKEQLRREYQKQGFDKCQKTFVDPIMKKLTLAQEIIEDFRTIIEALGEDLGHLPPRIEQLHNKHFPKTHKEESNKEERSEKNTYDYWMNRK